MCEQSSRPAADAWLPGFIDVIRRRFGHHIPDRRMSSVRKAVIDAYVASGERSLDAYRARLEDMPLDSPYVAELLGRLTVKESYFFRDEFTTATLRDVVLPRLVARAARQREIAVWSAGCSCGEEPYTVAILLDELAGASPSFAIRIVGTDVDAGALRAARAGEYAEWSVRTLPEALRRKYFEPKGSKFVLRDRYKKWVRFEANNLADSDSPAPEPNAFDLVLCRNVGIYLSDRAVEALYRKLARATRPDGLVVTAPSDPRPGQSAGLSTVLIRTGAHATVAYAPSGSAWETNVEKPREDPSDPEMTPTLPAGPPSMPPSAAPVPPPPRSPVISMVVPVSAADAEPPPSASAPPSTLSAARAAVLRAPLKAAPYLELALLEIERNDYGAAERALAKVLYLAPDLAEAHFRLGLLMARRGALPAARRSFFNALHAAETHGTEGPRWAAIIGAELARLDRR